MGEARAQFQTWAVKTYGGSVKTKTITREKYRRILRTIKGEIKNCADNSKFRFWMRSKGFLLDAYQENLFVVSTDGSGYKKVAVVEDFYDIIYDVHVRQGAKSGNHAGQKRTYKAVTENYAFLPREAVTRFLMCCTDCAKRSDSAESSHSLPPSTSIATSSTSTSSTHHLPLPPLTEAPWLPTTTFVTPLSSKIHHHYPKCHQEFLPINLTTRNCVIRLSVPNFPPPPPLAGCSTAAIDDDSDEVEATTVDPSSWNASTPSKKRRRIESSSEDLDEISPISTTDESVKEEMRVSTDTDPDNDGKTGESTTSTAVTTTTKKEKDDNSEELWNSYNMSKKSSTPQRDLSSPMHESVGSIHDETSSSGNKDEDDDDDDDDLIKLSQQDSERLKAFNMFVRLFVDENLDRCVPISRQPKEKVQAIIDSCTRQFPEFGERARKRIRTYLKSCRRNKRSRDTGTWPDSTRPTPAHLTSVQAEQILASACENESHNAKRMRLGLEPVSQPMPVIPGAESKTTSAPMMDHFAPANLASEAKLTSLSLVNNHINNNNNNSLSNNNVKLETLQRIGGGSAEFKNGVPHSTTSTSAQPHGTSSSAGTQIGSGIASLTAAAAFQHPTTPLSSGAISGHNHQHHHHHHRIMSPSPSPSNGGPQDLSMKRSPVGAAYPLMAAAAAAATNTHHSHQHQHSSSQQHAPPPILPQKLTQAEASAVRHLISGYRESAAFLLRSADELETLLLQQT